MWRNAVTTIEFSPTDDRYFLSGSLDDKVRLWNIPDHQVVDWSDVREMVTAVSYSPDGKVWDFSRVFSSVLCVLHNLFLKVFSALFR